MYSSSRSAVRRRFVGDDAIRNDAIRRLNKAVSVHARVARERTDQNDVRDLQAFRSGRCGRNTKRLEVQKKRGLATTLRCLPFLPV